MSLDDIWLLEPGAPLQMYILFGWLSIAIEITTVRIPSQLWRRIHVSQVWGQHGTSLATSDKVSVRIWVGYRHSVQIFKERIVNIAEIAMPQFSKTNIEMSKGFNLCRGVAGSLFSIVDESNSSRRKVRMKENEQIFTLENSGIEINS